VAEAIHSEDAEWLKELIFPVAVNSLEEAVDVIDSHGTSLLSLRHIPGSNIEDYEISRGEEILGEMEFVQRVLSGDDDGIGDKFAGRAISSLGETLFIAGPVFDQAGVRVGVILVGKSLDSMVRQIREATLSQVTIYGYLGDPLASTFILESRVINPAQVDLVLSRQNDETYSRDMTVSNIDYTEIIGKT
jgi:hypothetical protein